MTKIVYIDGIFDLFHRGHLEAIKKAKRIREDVYLIVGVVSDKDAAGYKRQPLFDQEDRYQLVSELRSVDQVIFPAPLKVTKEFIKRHNIDIVTHAFSDNEDFKKQEEFYEDCNDIFEMIPYYPHSSTTTLIKRIKNM